MKEQILALEHTDDLHSLRDKIARAQARRLVLLWGALEEPLTRRLDLVLMKRWAAMAGSDLAIVSGDEAVRSLARSAGVPCHPNLTASALAALSPRPEEPNKFDSHRRPRRRPAIPPPRTDRPRRVPPPLRIGLFSTAIFSVALVFLLLIPSARVKAVFPSRAIEAVGSLNPSLCTQLSTRLALSDRRPTGGRLFAPTAFAAGPVALTNLSSRILNLGAGLRVSSEGGVVFETVAGVALQPEETRIVPVRALEPGSAGNLATGKINRVLGPLSLSLTAENPSPTSGGEEAWRSAVTQSDWNALRAALEEKVLQQASGGLQALSGESRMTVEGSLRVEFDPLDAPDLPVHTPADSVGLTLHAEASLLACPLNLVLPRALEILGPHLHPDEVVSGENRTVRLAENEQGGIDLFASSVAFEIPDRNSAALALRARTPARAAEILRNRFGALEVPEISLSPSWIPLLPLFPYQISIEAAGE
jgi:hypothetical protein